MLELQPGQLKTQDVPQSIVLKFEIASLKQETLIVKRFGDQNGSTLAHSEP